MRLAFGSRSCAGCASPICTWSPQRSICGCKVAGPHLHVRAAGGQRERGAGQVGLPRVVPGHEGHSSAATTPIGPSVTRSAEAVESDYLLVNLWRAPLGRALSPDLGGAAVRAPVRQGGFRARPHMLRHSFASEVALLTKDPAIVKELLGHASVSSTDVYLHSRWADMRAAVEPTAEAPEASR